MQPTLDRRRLLKLGALAAGALATRRLRAEPFEPQPLERRGRPKRVLVLGGGLAGLAAADELIAAGHDVTVLEAQLRPGGRVLTCRDFSDGLVAEMGAGRIPDTHAVTLRYVERFGLKLDPFLPSGGAKVFHFGGKRFVREPGAEMEVAALPLEFSAEEHKLTLAGLDEKYLGPLLAELGDFETASWPPATLRKLEALTIADALRQRGASPAAIAYLTSGFEDDGALDFLRDSASHHTKALYKIRGGNDQLPAALARQHAARLRYGTRVLSLRQTAEAVEVVTVHAGETETLTAERAIVTLPFSVLRNIPITPRPPADKQAAIDRLRYGDVTRVSLQVRERFWAEQGLSGFAEVDRPLEVWSPTHDQPGRRGILQAYMYERLGRQIGALGESERRRYTADLFEDLFPGSKSRLEGGASIVWQDDPFARGAYTVFSAGELGTLPAVIARPEGRLHFAGEHASAYPGWMQGALQSGLRAAREVNEAST